jgi:hypothetical protein
MNKVIHLLFFSFFIFNTSFATIYYSQVSVGGGRDVTQLSNWSTSIGGGSSPASFLAGDEFHIVSADSMMASMTWVVPGSKLVIENGKFNNSGFAHSFTLDMQASGYYYHTAGTYNNVLFGSLNSSSGFEFRTGSFIASRAYPNLILNIPVSMSINNNLLVLGSLTIKGAGNVIFALNGSSVVTISNDFNILKGGVLGVYAAYNANISVGGNLNITLGNLLCSQGSGTFSMNVSGNFNLNGSGATGAFSMSKSSGPVSISVAGSFNMTAGSFNGVSSGATINAVLSLGGSFNLTGGAFYASSGTPTGKFTLLLSGLGNVTFNTSGTNALNVTVAGTYTLLTDFTIGKTLLINGGNLIISNKNLNLYDSLNVTSGNLTGGPTSKISFSSPSSVGANLPSITLQSLQINRPGQTISMMGNVTVQSLLTLTAGTLSIGSNTFTLNGGYSGSGILLGGATSNLISSGTNSTNLPSVELNTLTVNKTSLSNSGASINGPVTVYNTLNLTSGGISNTSQSLIIGSGATINMNTGTLSATPTFNGFYTLNYNGSTAVYTGFELYSGSPNLLDVLTINNTAGVTLNKNIEINQNLTINSGGILNASNFTIQEDANWINNGTFNPGTGTVNFYGNSTISGTPPGGHGFCNISIGNGAILTAPQSANVSLTRSFITSPTSTFNHNNGTVTFAGSISQTIPSLNFNNLTSTGSGSRTLVGSGMIGIAGAFTPGTNIYTTTGSTVNFNGSSAQNIPSFAFNNLIVSGTSVKTLNAGNVTVNGILSFGNGVISTGVNKVIIGSAGSVAGGGSGNYVNGNLQKNFGLGSSVSRTFEIGNSSSYLPITATFPTVSSAGNITASTIDGDHPQIASSCIDGTKSVNRYWTLSNSGVAPSNYGVVLNFAASDIDAGANFNNFQGALYNGNSWLNLTSGSKTSTSISLTGATAFGAFQVGETNAPVSVSIVVNPGTTICTGTSVTFTATPVNGGTAPTYQWKKNNVNTVTGSTYTDNSLVNSDIITVNMVSNSPCAFNPNATASVTMTVNTAATPTITASGPTTFCAGGSVTLTSSAASSYLWSTGAITSSIIVSTSGRDSVRITDANGCQAFSAATVVTVNSAATPTITASGPTTFCSGGSVTLTSSSATSYLWSTGATSASIVVSSSGKDSVTVTDVNGCQGTSASTLVTVNSCTFTWTGSADTDWNNGSNWNIGFAPDGTDDAIIPSGTPHMPVIISTTNIRSITINSGASLTLNAGSIFNVFGNIIDNGTFTDNGATTVFQGSASQSITGATRFENVTVNNASGLTLNNTVTVVGILSLLNGTVTSNGNLIVDLNTGAVAYNPSDLGSVSGNMKVKKNVSGIGTHDIACPLSGTTANDINDNTPVGSTRLYTWSGTTYSYTGIYNLATPLTVSTGYSMYFTGASTVLDFTGNYNHSASAYSISASHADSVNILMGNPYPSALDWEAASGWTKTNLDDVVAYYDGANHRYAYFINGTSVNGGTRNIPALNGFWVKRTGSSGSSTIGLDNRTRVSTTNPSMWRMGALSNCLKITASIGTLEDEALVRFDEEATEQYDSHLDAFKLINPDSTPSVYTSDHQTTYSINTLPAGNKLIALNLKAGYSGIHTLTIDGSESFDVPCRIFLEDKHLNVIKEVKGKTQYNCTVNSNDRSDRFNLRVSYNVNTSNNSKVSIGSYDKTVNILFNNAGNYATLNVYNLMGQQVGSVANADISSGAYSYLDPKLSEGIYVVKVTLGNDIFTSKVYIK